MHVMPCFAKKISLPAPLVYIGGSSMLARFTKTLDSNSEATEILAITNQGSVTQLLP